MAKSKKTPYVLDRVLALWEYVMMDPKERRRVDKLARKVKARK